jgi:hypothetical protein
MSSAAHCARLLSRSFLYRVVRTASLLFGCLCLAIAVVLPLEAFLSKREPRKRIGPHSPMSLTRIEPTTTAPDFCLPRASDGREVRLSEYRGHRSALLLFGSFG